MKLRWLHIFILLCIIIQGCKTTPPPSADEVILSKRTAQEDFNSFRNIIESAHPSLNIFISDKKRTALFDSIYATIKKDITVRELNNKLAFLINKAGCSHSYAALPVTITTNLYDSEVFFPLPVIWIENKMLVNAEDLELPRGTEILNINHQPAATVLNNLAMYNTVDGYNRPIQKNMACDDFGYQYYLFYGSTRRFEIKYKDTAGKIKTETFSPIDLRDLKERESGRYYFDASDVDYSLHTHEKDGYAVLRIATMDFDSENKQEAFNDFCKNSFELLKKKPEITTLMVDLRQNPGGRLENCFRLFSYLYDQPFREYKKVTTRIKSVPYSDLLTMHYTENTAASVVKRLSSEFERTIPGEYVYADSLIETHQPEKNRFTGKVYVLTNHNVTSAASYLAWLIQQSGRGKIVGNETAGGVFASNGFSVLEYYLPYSKIEFGFAYARLYYTFGKSQPASGIIPDYRVADTRESFDNNEDRQIYYITDSLMTQKN